MKVEGIESENNTYRNIEPGRPQKYKLLSEITLALWFEPLLL